MVFICKLKVIGVVNWKGKAITPKKEIKITEKPDFADWYKELMEKVHPTHEDEPTTGTGTIYEPHIPPENDDWIEIDIEDGMKVKLTRAKLKEKLLN